MYEEAQRIFDYLPIRSVPLEQEYIQYLWETFSVLDNTETSTRSFSIMPFHLLFMMAIQYKVIKISDHNQKYYKNFIEKNKNLEKESINILLSQKKSVFDISSIRERSIGDLFNSITQDNIIIKDYKQLIDERNKNFAHANSGREINIEEKIDRYINLLENIQKSIVNINQNIAESLIIELRIQDLEDISNVIDLYLLDDRSNPKDFEDMISILLQSEEFDFDQWEQVVDKGLDLAYEATIQALMNLALTEVEDGKRFNIINKLYENHLSDDIKFKILQKEKDLEIIELLNT